jgi:hypothetical protein
VIWLEVAQFVAADLTSRQIAGQPMLALEKVSAHPHEAGCYTPRRDRGIAREMASVPRHLLRGSRQDSRQSAWCQ